MRFIHIADIHLGAEPERDKPWAKNRGRELWDTFERLIMRVREEKPDLLFIAGDLFHRQPLLRELKEVNYLFSQIPDTKILLIAGNHDYIKKDSYYRTFEWSENVIFLKSREPESVYIAGLNTEVYGFSYYERDIEEALYDNILPTDSGHINILLAHGGDEKHIPIRAGRLALNGFDYIALGHIHKSMGGGNGIRYSGALEPLDINDMGEHGYIYGEVDKKGCRTTFVPFASRSYIQLEINVNPEMTFQEIKARITGAIAEKGSENIYRILLTGLRDEAMIIPEERICELGNIGRIEDRTVPDYQYDRLIKENGDNLLSRYIKYFVEDGRDLSELEKKALDYGVRALMFGE